MKYKVVLDVESDEKPKNVKKFLNEILDVTKHTDTVSVGKVDVNVDKGKERSTYGFIRVSDGSSLKIGMCAYKPEVTRSSAKAYIRQSIDFHDIYRDGIDLHIGFKDELIADALIDHLSTNTLRKIVNDAIDRTRETTTGESQGSET